jgi:hypothetical protein
MAGCEGIFNEQPFARLLDEAGISNPERLAAQSLSLLFGFDFRINYALQTKASIPKVGKNHQWLNFRPVNNQMLPPDRISLLTP